MPVWTEERTSVSLTMIPEADAYYSILGWLDQAVDEFDESSTDKILKRPCL